MSIGGLGRCVCGCVCVHACVRACMCVWGGGDGGWGRAAVGEGEGVV